jgi:hypothetical protein
MWLAYIIIVIIGTNHGSDILAENSINNCDVLKIVVSWFENVITYRS